MMKKCFNILLVLGLGVWAPSFGMEGENHQLNLMMDVKPADVLNREESNHKNWTLASLENRWEDALQWLYRAVEKKEGWAAYWLGNAHARADNQYHVEKDINKAIEFFKRSAEWGYVHAYAGLARLYALGNGVKKDSKKAAYYYGQACKVEDKDNNYCALRDIYQQGPKNVPMTVANRQGLTEYYNQHGNQKEQRRIMEALAAEGDVGSMSDVANFYARGTFGEKEPEKALRLYLKILKEVPNKEGAYISKEGIILAIKDLKALINETVEALKTLDKKNNDEDLHEIVAEIEK